ncbi:MAG: trigger factor [Bdellovibrionaceae bacterium]|nr:trigger factor [Pseudobdellovibrionaceae bacterium]
MSNLEKLDGLNRKISVNIPADDVSKAFEEAYQSIKKNAKAPGFREGKVPLTKIKSMYKDQVKQDVIQDLINKSYGMALQKHEVNPIDYPKIDFDSIDENKDFAFTATFEVRPHVDASNFEGLQIEKEKINIDQTKIDEVLTNMQNHHAEEVPVMEDRPAKDGDTAIIDFEGYVNNEPLENGSSKDFRLELGSNSFIPGFEDGILGMAIDGEKSIDLSFPEEYHEKSIAGKPVTFKVKLNKLVKKQLPELNDDLAKIIDESFSSFDDLKQRITADLTRDENQRIEGNLKNDILKALVKANPVEVPTSLMQEQKKKLVEDTKNRLKQQGFSDKDWEDYQQKWDGDLNETAAFMIQSSFLIDDLANKLSIKAEATDFDQKYNEFAQSMNIDIETIKGFYKEDQKNQLAYQIVEEKVVKHLLGKAKVTEIAAQVKKD